MGVGDRGVCPLAPPFMLSTWCVRGRWVSSAGSVERRSDKQHAFTGPHPPHVSNSLPACVPFCPLRRLWCADGNRFPRSQQLREWQPVLSPSSPGRERLEGSTGLLCPVQVAAVNGIELCKDDRELWELISGSRRLSSMTVTDFLDLPSREARRDLLHVASKQTDGTHSLDLEDAQVLADALVTRLSRGV